MFFKAFRLVCLAALLSGSNFAIADNQSEGLIAIDDAIGALREYCKSCHAVGNQKFITSNNNFTVWKYIQQNRAPSGALWINSIRQVLDWPGGQVPPQDGTVRPGIRYMPIGAKRPPFARARIGGQLLRPALVERLSHAEEMFTPEVDLSCVPQGQGYVPGRADGLALGRPASADDCANAVAAAGEQVVCANSGGGLRAGEDWRPYNIEDNRPLGRYANSLENCTGATARAGQDVVCTFTGIGWKPTNIHSGEWFGSSSLHEYCTQAAAAASDGTVCAWFGEGDGSGQSWYRTDIASGRTIGRPGRLDDCLNQQ